MVLFLLLHRMFKNMLPLFIKISLNPEMKLYLMLPVVPVQSLHSAHGTREHATN